MNFNLERFKQLPQRQNATWQGGLFRMPAWMEEDGQKPYRLRMVLWADQATGVVSEPRIIEEGEDADCILLEALLDFGLSQQTHRPSTVEVQNAALADHLSSALRPAQIACGCVSSLSAIQECLDDLAEHMCGCKEPPAALSGEGVRVEHMRTFAKAAASFYAAKPWERLTDIDLIAIKEPAPPKGLGYVSVMGSGGLTYGLGFFESIKQFEKMQTASTPGRFFAKNGCWSVPFGPITGLPFADADLWEDHDLPIAGDEAYPFACWFGPKKKMLRPDAGTLTFVEGLLQALATTTEDDLDAGEWSKTVSMIDGEKKLLLALHGEREGSFAQPEVGMMDLRRAMEKGMANLHRLLDEQDFESVEKANAFIAANLKDGRLPEVGAETPLERAQELMYETGEATGRQRLKLARQALKICPDCADAYVLLAESKSNQQQACELFSQGVDAGERALGPEAFEEHVGQFWGILETRPYMRARAGLAQCLWQLGQREESVKHYQELLRLNPDDNQGIRYLLAACLLELDTPCLGRDGELNELIERYDEDGSPFWLYLQALAKFRQEGNTAQSRKRLKVALKSNQHVPPYLAGRRRLPKALPEAYSPGDEDEAVWCASEIKSGWKSTPGAMDWLKQVSKPRK